jgi:pimeloyl-ACP methyl ester carboxylesterase
MSTPWIVLPGLAETPEEFDRVLELLPGRDIRVVDPWQTPVTAPVNELRTATKVGTPVRLAGHSIGGLAVLRWALTHPDEVEQLVLIDTSLTSETGWRWLYPGTRADRIIRSFLIFVGWTGLPRLIGPTLRRLFVWVGSATNRDLLSKATARARYGAANSWLLFWGDLANSWTLAAEVESLLKNPPPNLPPPLFLVATGGSSRFTAKSWLAGQRELAAKLNTTGLEVLSDSAHLVHLDRPDAIAKALTD